MAQYARYRAPAESGQKLVAPPWPELAGVVAGNHAWRNTADLQISGQALPEFALAARREIVARAQEYVSDYAPSRDIGDAAALADRPLIFTGHQPEIVHPGVWIKNFAAGELAHGLGGVALNLVIDADACRTTAIRVPSGTVEEPRFATVQFDAPGRVVPWEERRVIDHDLWSSFARRVGEATTPLLADRLLDAWWQVAVERSSATDRIGASLAQARHLAELAWGQQSLELPQSDMCRTAAFRQFACHVFSELPRFVAAYNGALDAYRRGRHIRNHAQPVSNLERRGQWLQSPFWIWSTTDARRRALFVRSDGSRLTLSDLESFERPLAGRDSTDASAAVEALGQWEMAGLKLRSRALVTTMFARLAVADLFIHGIGGAKYDEVTDAICERFFQTPPPRFAAISGTLRLPIARSVRCEADARQLRHELRAIEFHPERFEIANGSSSDNALRDRLSAEKRRWIETPKTPANAAARHAAIAAANQGMRPFVAHHRQRLEARLAQAAECARASRILDSREYAFCLFPRDQLQTFLLDFAAKAL